jgi:hypothetical protein
MNDPSTSEGSGWVPPPPSASSGVGLGRILLGFAGVAVVISLGAALLFANGRGSSLGPGELMSLDLGSGSAQCEMTGQTRTFATNDRVYMATTFDGPLPAGTTVSYDIEFQGSSIYNDSEVLKTEANCVSFPILEPPVEPGHYKLTVKPETGPPISGEFDVE